MRNFYCKHLVNLVLDIDKKSSKKLFNCGIVVLLNSCIIEEMLQ